MTVTARGQFAAKLIRIDFHRLWIQRFSEKLPRIVHAARVGRATVTFLAQPGPSLFWGGSEMGWPSIVRHSEGENTLQRTCGSATLAHPATYYRRQAARAREIAKAVTTRAIKSRLLDEALHFDELAEKTENPATLY
jgi:hypothetical protein